MPLLVPEVLPGIHMPSSFSRLDSLEYLLTLEVPASRAVVKFIIQSAKDLKFEGGPKFLNDAQGSEGDSSGAAKPTNTLKGVQDMVERLVLHPNEHSMAIHTKEYQHFPRRGDMKITLETLIKTNPFIASALQAVTQNGAIESFKVVSYSPDTLDNNCSWFSHFLDTLQGEGHKVNATFNTDLTLRSIEPHNEDGTPMAAVTDDGDDMEKWCSSLLFNLIFYASCVHGTLHVLHFLMGACIEEAAEDSKNDNMQAWAAPFANGLDIKYQEVYLLLINKNKVEPDKTILTGSHGFGGSQRTRGLCLQIILAWGMCTTADDFLSKFLLRGIASNLPANLELNVALDNAGCLEQYMKHLSIIPRYADALTGYFTPEEVMRADNSIAEFMGDTGLELGNLKLKSLSSWVHIMSATGLLHGGTLSYTRLIAVPEVLQWREYDNPNWSEYDVNLATGGLGTIVGMQHERHVFSSTIQRFHAYDGDELHPHLAHVLDLFGEHMPSLVTEGVSAIQGVLGRIHDRIHPRKRGEERHRHFDRVKFWVDKLANIPAMDQEFRNMLQAFDTETTAYKKEYENELETDMAILYKLGWILTDFCPDGSDGKQLTLCTYI